VGWGIKVQFLVGLRDFRHFNGNQTSLGTHPAFYSVVSDASENKVLKRIFGPKRDEVAGRWRKLHKLEELHYLYSSPSIIRIMKLRMRWAGHVVRVGEKRNVYRLLVGKPGGRRPLGRPRHRWVDNIKMNPVETGWGVD
jgi:hypothetical protein